MKRYLRQLFPLLAGLFLTGVVVQGVRAQPINTVAGKIGVSATAGDGGAAISATFSAMPQYAMAVDRVGDFFVSDNNGYSIRKIDARGIITTIAGTGQAGSGETGDGGPATAATLTQVSYMAADSIGDLFFIGADFTGFVSIRKVDVKTGVVTTVINSNGSQPFANGTLAKDAKYTYTIAKSIVVDPQGNLYIVNPDVSAAAVFKIDNTGKISTYLDLSGQTTEDGSPIDFGYYMDDLIMDRAGTLFWADNQRGIIYKATRQGMFTKVAGAIYAYTYGGDGGPATDALMYLPCSMDVDETGNVYISDTYNYVIRKVDLTGTISTIAGVPADPGAYGDGGPASSAGIGTAARMRLNADGNLLLLDAADLVVRMIGNRVQKFILDPVPAKTYGDADFVLSTFANNVSVPSFRSSNLSVATVAADGTVHITGAGTAILEADFPAVGTDTAGVRTQTLTVAKKGLTVTADDKTITAGDVLPALTVKYNGFVSGEDAGDLTTPPTATTTATSVSAAGNYPITVSGGVANNYAFTYVPGTLFIAQPVLKAQTISFAVLTDRIYGVADFDPGAGSDNATIPVVLRSSNTGVATIVNGIIHIVGAGTTTITASQAGDAFYSPAADVPQSLTVDKAVLSVTADNKTVVFGSVLPALTLSYSGFVNGEGVTVLATAPQASVTATAGSPAGDYPINISPGVAANYTLGYHPGVLTIGALAQTINFNPLTVKNYTDGDFPAGAVSTNTSIPLTYNSSDPSVATVSDKGIIHIINTGVTTITASQAGSGDYTAAPDVSQMLTVGPAPLIITPDDKSRVQGQANPVFTFNYSGFKEGETPDMLLRLPVASTPANVDSHPGFYLITADGAEGGSHYAISYGTGALTVVVDSTKNADKLETWCSSPTMLEVNIFAVANQKATIELFSLGGQQVVALPVYLINASNIFHIPVGNVAPGLYVVQVQGQYLKLSQKIRIVR